MCFGIDDDAVESDLEKSPKTAFEAHFFVTFLGLVISPTSIVVSHLSLAADYPRILISKMTSLL